jgi:prepilin-type N-terminal cleavage/methylation domain-containing protein
MKKSEKGFVLMEVLVATSLAAIVLSISVMTVVYVLKNNQQTSDHMAAVYYADNTGYLVSNDVQMADSITTENLTQPELLVMSWTEWGYDEDSVYHVVTYSIEDVSGEIGKLKRVHQDSNGSYEEIIIADCIYSNEADPDNTTQVNYQEPVLNMKITTVFGSATGVKEYEIYSRPNFR